MVTRHIEKNSPTQVNADKIGVQVSADPIITVDSIVVDYTYNLGTLSSMHNGEHIIIDNTGYGMYWFSGVIDTVDGNTMLRWENIPTASTQYPLLWSYVSAGVESGVLLFNCSGSGTPEDPYTNPQDVGMSIGQVLGASESGSVIQENVEPSGNAGFYNVNFGYGITNTNNQLPWSVFNSGWEGVKGLISGTEVEVTSNLEFNYAGTSSDYGWTAGFSVWKCESFKSWAFANRYLVTPGERNDVVVGETAYWNVDDALIAEGEHFYPETIKSLVTSSEPGEINCVVSYSIKGDSFTDVDTVLTDENNVICNIPRYVYLKFTQDVDITEE